MNLANWMAAVMLIAAAMPASAHHSAAAEYYAQVKTWSGTIARFSWMNPHTWVWFDVTDATGNVTHMDCEGSSPNGLVRDGWTKETLTPGLHVTIEGNPAKDKPNGCKVRAVILPGGRRMTMGYQGPGSAPTAK